jgi:hypothetical protein
LSHSERTTYPIVVGRMIAPPLEAVDRFGEERGDGFRAFVLR